MSKSDSPNATSRKIETSVTKAAEINTLIDKFQAMSLTEIRIAPPSTSSVHSILESIPTEIKLAVFEELSDFASLSALVHASPIFHQVYLNSREQILTKIIFLELRSRVKHGNLEKLIPTWTLTLKSHDTKPEVKSAIIACCAQAHISRKEDTRLSVPQCLALRNITSILRGSVPRIILSFRNGPLAKSNGPKCYVKRETKSTIQVLPTGGTRAAMSFRLVRGTWHVASAEFLDVLLDI